MVGLVGAIIPAPHPPVPALLDQGMRILDWDTFCASEPDLIDPARLLPNAGLL